MEGGKINNRNSNIDMIRIVAMLLVVYKKSIKRKQQNNIKYILFKFLFRTKCNNCIESRHQKE